MKSWAYGHIIYMYFLLNDISFGIITGIRICVIITYPTFTRSERDEILFFISLFIFSIFSVFTRLNIHLKYISGIALLH